MVNPEEFRISAESQIDSLIAQAYQLINRDELGLLR